MTKLLILKNFHILIKKDKLVDKKGKTCHILRTHSWKGTASGRYQHKQELAWQPQRKTETNGGIRQWKVTSELERLLYSKVAKKRRVCVYWPKMTFPYLCQGIWVSTGRRKIRKIIAEKVLQLELGLSRQRCVSQWITQALPVPAWQTSQTCLVYSHSISGTS